MKLRASNMFEKRALLPGGIMLLLTAAFATMTTFIALYGQSMGIADVHLFFVAYAIATIICRPIVGRIIDRVGFFMPGILSTLGLAVSMVLISLSTDIVLLCVAGVFAGLGLGTAMGTLQTMAVAAAPTERRGVATSTYFFGFDAGIAVGAIIAGVISHAMGYAAMYMIFTIFPLLAFTIFIIIGKKRIAKYSE